MKATHHTMMALMAALLSAPSFSQVDDCIGKNAMDSCTVPGQTETSGVCAPAQQQPSSFVWLCDTTINFIPGLQYSQISLTDGCTNGICDANPVYGEETSSETALQHCKRVCQQQLDGCKGLFFQKHSNGHEICGFYSEPVDASAGAWHGHQAGSQVCSLISGVVVPLAAAAPEAAEWQQIVDGCVTCSYKAYDCSDLPLTFPVSLSSPAQHSFVPTSLRLSSDWWGKRPKAGTVSISGGDPAPFTFPNHGGCGDGVTSFGTEDCDHLTHPIGFADIPLPQPGPGAPPEGPLVATVEITEGWCNGGQMLLREFEFFGVSEEPEGQLVCAATTAVTTAVTNVTTPPTTVNQAQAQAPVQPQHGVESSTIVYGIDSTGAFLSPGANTSSPAALFKQAVAAVLGIPLRSVVIASVETTANTVVEPLAGHHRRLPTASEEGLLVTFIVAAVDASAAVELREAMRERRANMTALIAHTITSATRVAVTVAPMSTPTLRVSNQTLAEAGSIQCGKYPGIYLNCHSGYHCVAGQCQPNAVAPVTTHQSADLTLLEPNSYGSGHEDSGVVSGMTVKGAAGTDSVMLALAVCTAVLGGLAVFGACYAVYLHGKQAGLREQVNNRGLGDVTSIKECAA